MRLLLWFVAGTLQTWTGARPPSRWEEHMTLTADVVSAAAADAPPIDPARVRWTVRRGRSGDELRYDYPTDGFTVRFRALKAASAEAADAWWAEAGDARELDDLDGATLAGGRTFVWGDRAECAWIHRDGAEVGYRCRGRSGDRLFTATVWGVTAEEARPEVVLAFPLYALPKWNPDGEPFAPRPREPFFARSAGAGQRFELPWARKPAAVADDGDASPVDSQR
jgi:hypothetical protein